jgi:hypothetical protein
MAKLDAHDFGLYKVEVEDGCDPFLKLQQRSLNDERKAFLQSA